MGMAGAAVETRAEAAGRRARARRVLLLAVAAAALIGGACKLWDLRRYRRAMIEIKQEVRDGRHGHAARKLTTLLAWKPDSDEAAYLLGVCEKARGQPHAALRAWERVPPGSPFGARAIQGRMQWLIERGGLAEAEALIIRAMSDPRGDGSKLGLFLGLVYSLQGRIEDRQRVIEASWDRLNEAGEGASEPAILLIRLHMQTPTIEEVRAFLDQAARSAPEDDRVWLGRAKLAIRDGSYDQASRWLDACLRKRPDDLPVWCARLDWAMAIRRLADAAPSAGASAREGVHSRPGPEVDRLARRVSRRPRRRASRARTAGRRRFGRSRRSGAPGGHCRKGRQGGSRRRIPTPEVRDRSTPGALRKTLPAQPDDARCPGTGQPGGAAQPAVRGERLQGHRRGHRCGFGAPRPARSVEPERTGASPAERHPRRPAGRGTCRCGSRKNALIGAGDEHPGEKRRTGMAQITAPSRFAPSRNRRTDRVHPPGPIWSSLGPGWPGSPVNPTTGSRSCSSRT